MWRLFCLLFLCLACSRPDEKSEQPFQSGKDQLFNRLSSNETGIKFINEVKEQEDLDVFRYRNFYNGGGVGIADFNNDGLSDVYLTSNMHSNQLYLNKGSFTFENITETAGVKGTKSWSTGVSIADVNADGFLDIYVCNAGDREGGRRENELFINNGNLTFTERAEEFGLADKGFTTHAVFFDYDKDGDLDCYVLNNSFRPISTLGYKNLRPKRDPDGGDKLYQNDNGKFVDVSENAGIFGSVIGFGLGVTVGDVNQDSWPDLYISNDFYERDYLYINKKDGTFSEQLESRIGHLSMFSMGADMADLDNDGYPEIFSTDMLPEDDYRLKTLASFESYDVYQIRLNNGYYHQYMRNMLQANNGDGTFREIGELAGVSSSDWSWGALIADFDNDGYKEIFVCNGIYKDVTNLDFIEFFGSNAQIKAAMEGRKIDWKSFLEKMPSVKLSNHMFQNQGDWSYSDVSKDWGLSEPSFSNGAAYGDLDNDGDLDLIVNNVNQELFVYKNQSREKIKGNYLSLNFKGTDKNLFGLGTTVKVFVKGQILMHHNMPIRGFQSSMDYKMNIGLGKVDIVDSLSVEWPDGKIQVIKNVVPNQFLTVSHQDAKDIKITKVAQAKVLLKEFQMDEVRHVENDFNDFDRDRLLYHMLSTQGPAFSKADLNNDGLDDIFIGGSIGHAGSVHIQTRDGKFSILETSVFEADKESEDVNSLFFDADKDGDEDLYVVSGGNENLNQSRHILDRYYENKGLKDGLPVFEKDSTDIPEIFQSGSCIKPADVDNDGDIDLFLGTRLIPSFYGLPGDQFLLLNDGNGRFTDATNSFAPELKKLGMVTDAIWFDYDKNTYDDLIIVGEGMPITMFLNDGKRLTKTSIKGLTDTEGWWNTIAGADLDNDGDTDFVLGNLGANSKFKPSENSPVNVYVNDFDQNGSMEPIFVYSQDGKQYPMAFRIDLIKQMSSLKKQFVYFKDYAGKTVQEIFGSKSLERATKLTFNQVHSSLLIRTNDGFQLKPLHIEAQVSPVFDIEIIDLNKDGKPDLIMGGNLFSVKPEIGRYDAMHGLVLLNEGGLKFSPMKGQDSGLKVEGETRHISAIKTARGLAIAFIRNNDSIRFFEIMK